MEKTEKLNPAQSGRQKKSTKQLILEAAFSFYRRPWDQEFSMSQLASKVGISKTAIYRHFKNREAVLEAMKDYFFDVLFTQLVKIHEKNYQEDIFDKRAEDFIIFFTNNSQYINYIVTQHSEMPNFEKIVNDELQSRGYFSNFEDVAEEKFLKTELKKYTFVYFYSVSIIFFIKLRERILLQNKTEMAVSNVEEFAEKLVGFLHKGLGEVIKERFKIDKISPERMAELDKLCKISESDLPEENRIFTAFASVITKTGLGSVTVESIAKELNMAKSSLYFYFDNKREMLVSLVSKELSFLEMACVENRAEAKTYPEYIYINMKTALSYFCARPSILSLCGYLIQSGSNRDLENGDCIIEVNSGWEVWLREVLKNFDLGFPVCPEFFTLWTGILTVGLIILRLKHEFTEEETDKALKYVFDLVMHGV